LFRKKGCGLLQGSGTVAGLSNVSALPYLARWDDASFGCDGSEWAAFACGAGFEVYADFMVCPLTEPKAAGIQLVCVQSAGNIRASELKQGEDITK
jgi:hypothetical protein